MTGEKVEKNPLSIIWNIMCRAQRRRGQMQPPTAAVGLYKLQYELLLNLQVPQRGNKALCQS